MFSNSVAAVYDRRTLKPNYATLIDRRYRKRRKS
jgi:hypothetical protein